jgi:guanine nucleotide-binding protein G(i) subunit alpha
MDGQKPEMKKWIPYFEDSTIIFGVDLACYNQISLEKSQNKMMEALMQFDSVVNSRWLRRTSVILLLTNVSSFRRELAKSPMSGLFPDYGGGNDVNRAVKYIVRRFSQVNRGRLDLYHLLELYPTFSTPNIRLVVTVIKRTILHNTLRDCGIF